MKRFCLLLIIFVQVFLCGLVKGQNSNQNGLGEIRDYSQDPKYKRYSNEDIFNDIFFMGGSASCSLRSRNGETIYNPNLDYHYGFLVYPGGRFVSYRKCANYGGIIRFSRDGEFFIDSYWISEDEGNEFCENENISMTLDNLFGSLLSGGTYIYHPITESSSMYMSNIELVDKFGNVFLWHCMNQTYSVDPDPIRVKRHSLLGIPVDYRRNKVGNVRLVIFSIFIVTLFCAFIVSCFFLCKIFKELGKKWWEAFIPLRNLNSLLDIVGVYRMKIIWIILCVLWLLGFRYIGRYDSLGKYVKVDYKRIIGCASFVILILIRECLLFKAYYRLFRKYGWSKWYSVLGTIFFPIGACVLGFGNFQCEGDKQDEKENN